MAGSIMGIVPRRPFLLLTMFMTVLRTSHALDALDLFDRSSDSCPQSYDQCGGDLPSNFCCPSSSTCVIANSTTAICCPSGSTCDYISPIDCDIQQQNATAHPKSTVKTTRLDGKLSSCGDSCCPFGYSCGGDRMCIMDKHSTNTTSASTSTGTGTIGATFTPFSSSTADPGNTSACPSFPSKAVVAGFFPGAIFGAVLALLIGTCIRRRTHKKMQKEDPKFVPHWSHRTSTGAVMGISSPMASEDASYRTDFLLRPSSANRSSVGARSARSRVSRTGSRVRSLFNAGPKLDMVVPPVPKVPNPVTPPRQRQPSTESIKVYSPPGAFSQSRKFLGPEPYPSTIARPDTTFTDLMQVVGFNDTKGNPTYKVTVDEK
ncbi:hypothetical protein N7532_009620 [Penicillium argentinense]|uniref:Uncharacterized protein n=1 Tax=Penicillium argentinense TaxID=1131581 RepID=A0A9W9EZX7_9EURO|nr:uncharacterized protein N7532_009620 [Penicillium argentinense]KAJ5090936.1 hypothetical protein N7532_009620 [Penicillium argentinense]